MNKNRNNRDLQKLRDGKPLGSRLATFGLIAALLVNPLWIGMGANAAVVETGAATQGEMVAFDTVNKHDLLADLQSEELRDQLVAYGVNPADAEQRVAALTDSEIAELNQRIAEQPAGAGIVGAAVTVFVVLVITDMLCATNVFRFVNCINR